MKPDELHPTLWRTCRVLAGPTRVRLLRVLLANPGLTVTETAERLNLGLSRASQELRRINARGLLAVCRVGAEVRYRLAPDPLVADAAPLTESIQRVLRRGGDRTTADFVRVARGFTYPRRLAIVRRLLTGPAARVAIRHATGIPLPSLKRHLRILVRCRLVRARDGVYHLLPACHPLLRAILDCLRRDSMGS